MLKVGLTGNIASGKSTVENYLKTKGFKVTDADEISHNLLLNNDVKDEVLNAFKEEDIEENGEISRSKLGRIVFADDEKRKKLEAILHPKIRVRIEDFFKEVEGEKIAFVEVPLLFEAKFDDMFDKIILVFADDEIRLNRLMKRNDLRKDAALKRIAVQMNQQKKKPLSAFVIINNRSLEELKAQTDKVLSILI